MDELWPWLMVAGAGALHGLNPVTGWLFIAGRDVHASGQAQTLRALMPIAIGHLASMAVVAAAVVLGRSLDRIVLQLLAGSLLTVVAGLHWRARRTQRTCATTGQAGLALWSFIVSTGHGAGLMLVPALMPLCVTGPPGRAASASGLLTMAMAAVGVHTAAVLAASGVAATLASRLWRLRARLFLSTKAAP
jgi:hypothetical protein